MASVTTGLENCLESPPKVLRDAARFGVLANQASVNKDFEYAGRCSPGAFPEGSPRCSRHSTASGASSRKT